MLTALGRSSISQPTGRVAVSIGSASGICRQSKRGAPMLTVAPPPAADAESSPPAVSIVQSPPSRVATQRVALPQAETSEPSAFQIRIATSATSQDARTMSWSQPMPVWRSAIATAASRPIATGCARVSITTKSLPRPCILLKRMVIARAI